MCPRILERAEALGKIEPVCERLEVGFRVRVIVRHVRPRMRLRHAEIGEQEGDRLQGHRRAAVGVNRELVGQNALPLAAHRQQTLGERRRFARGDEPPDDVATEHVKEHLEGEVAPLLRSLEPRDVPAPELVRRGGEEFRRGVHGVSALRAPLARRSRTSSWVARTRYLVRSEQ